MILRGKDLFKYLSKEFDMRYYPFEYMSDFEKFEEKLSSKEIFYSFLTGKKVVIRVWACFFKVWDRSEMKAMKNCHDLYLKWEVLLLAEVLL